MKRNMDYWLNPSSVFYLDLSSTPAIPILNREPFLTGLSLIHESLARVLTVAEGIALPFLRQFRYID